MDSPVLSTMRCRLVPGTSIFGMLDVDLTAPDHTAGAPKREGEMLTASRERVKKPSV